MRRSVFRVSRRVASRSVRARLSASASACGRRGLMTGLMQQKQQGGQGGQGGQNGQSGSGFKFGGAVLGAAGAVVAGMAAWEMSKASMAIHADEKQEVDWNAVRGAIADLLDDFDYDGGIGYGPVFVRLAWHASGSYSKYDGTGGSNGATMRFKPESGIGANAGLAIARNRLEAVKAKFPNASYADIWTLAGSVAIEELGGPKIDWRPGRSDEADGSKCPPDGRLPDASKHEDHLRSIFYRMGFNDQEIVALAGAHALGKCHTDRSGYDGPWSRSPSTFSNEYFRLLLDAKWGVRRWNGPLQYENIGDTDGASQKGNGGKDLMMLPADLALIEDPEFLKYVEIYAKDQDRFFKDFSAAWKKLIELGVPAFEGNKGGLGFVWKTIWAPHKKQQ